MPYLPFRFAASAEVICVALLDIKSGFQPQARHQHNFASEAASLYELTKKKKVYQWGESLKGQLCAALVLVYPVSKENFNLDRDARGYGIGGQWYEGYYSRKLSKHKRNYCLTRRELQPVLECIKHDHKYPYFPTFLIKD